MGFIVGAMQGQGRVHVPMWYNNITALRPKHIYIYKDQHHNGLGKFDMLVVVRAFLDKRMLHRSLDIRVLFRNSRIPAIVPQALTLGHIQVGSYRYRSFAEGLYTL